MGQYKTYVTPIRYVFLALTQRYNFAWYNLSDIAKSFILQIIDTS